MQAQGRGSEAQGRAGARAWERGARACNRTCASWVIGARNRTVVAHVDKVEEEVLGHVEVEIAQGGHHLVRCNLAAAVPVEATKRLAHLVAVRERGRWAVGEGRGDASTLMVEERKTGRQRDRETERQRDRGGLVCRARTWPPWRPLSACLTSTWTLRSSESGTIGRTCRGLLGRFAVDGRALVGRCARSAASRRAIRRAALRSSFSR